LARKVIYKVPATTLPNTLLEDKESADGKDATVAVKFLEDYCFKIHGNAKGVILRMIKQLGLTIFFPPFYHLPCRIHSHKWTTLA
jgi:hypothetical protein